MEISANLERAASSALENLSDYGVPAFVGVYDPKTGMVRMLSCNLQSAPRELIASAITDHIIANGN